MTKEELIEERKETITNLTAILFDISENDNDEALKRFSNLTDRQKFLCLYELMTNTLLELAKHPLLRF